MKQETKKKKSVIINDSAGWYTIKENKGTVFYTLYTKQNLFTGKATKDDRDEWNEDLGKRLAKLRAIQKMKQFKLEQLRLELDLAQTYLNERSYETLRYAYQDEMKVLRLSIKRLTEKIQSADPKEVEYINNTCSNKVYETAD